VSKLLIQACRYRDFAAECVRLADSAVETPVREGFRRLAMSYLLLAQAELTRAEAAAERDQATIPPPV
jgi:hypothetical protein